MEIEGVNSNLLNLKCDLMILIRDAISEMTQKDAAKLMKTSQPRVNKLVRGHVDLFSVEWLLKAAQRCGIEIKLTPP